LAHNLTHSGILNLSLYLAHRARPAGTRTVGTCRAANPTPDPSGLPTLQIQRSTRRDSPRCKSHARPVGTSLNLYLAPAALDPPGLPGLQVPRPTRRDSLPCKSNARPARPAGTPRAANPTPDPSGLRSTSTSHPPRSTRRDSPRCKSHARTAGTSLNLYLAPDPLDLYLAPDPLDPPGLPTLQIPRPTRRDFAPLRRIFALDNESSFTASPLRGD
jgi:hypothetical protein